MIFFPNRGLAPQGTRLWVMVFRALVKMEAATVLR